jgi:hypothetical protein
MMSVYRIIVAPRPSVVLGPIPEHEPSQPRKTKAVVPPVGLRSEIARVIDYAGG